MKYLGLYLTKYIEDLWTCLLETTEHQRKRYSCLWIGRYNIKKMSVLPKLTYSFNTFLVKNPARLFCRYADKITLKYIWKRKGTRISKMILKEKNKVGGITLPVSRLITQLQTSNVCAVGEGISI